ncbi:hypothetical protein EZS27_036291 [termite gut metagenome]|uniref:Uncharacterized protein n=1 Tax=termite gut metagenome TaxID=433724 RepID=A0A5J4PUP0_9ZZZZ
MIVISPTEFRNDPEKYLDIAKDNEKVIIQRSSIEMYELVRKERVITDEDLERGLTADELLNRVRPRIKELFQK